MNLLEVIPMEVLPLIFERMPDAVFFVNSSNILESMNPACELLTGYKESELIGRSVYEFLSSDFSLTEGKGREAIQDFSLERPFSENRTWETYLRSKSGAGIPIEISVVDVDVSSDGLTLAGSGSGKSGKRTIHVAFARDIRSRKILEDTQRMTMATLKKMAFVDELTMIPNRRSFYESFRKLISAIQRRKRDAIVAVADIDNFKQINDTYGHDIGDMVLKNISKVFLENLREEDVVGRIGGEEFGFLLPDTNLNGAFVVLERLRLAVKQFRFFVFENYYLNVTISTGYVRINGDQTVEEAIKRADIALYKAKNAGKDLVTSYDLVPHYY